MPAHNIAPKESHKPRKCHGHSPAYNITSLELHAVYNLGSLAFLPLRREAG